MPREGSYAGQAWEYTAPFDATWFNVLQCRVQGQAGGENFKVGLRDWTQELKVPAAQFLDGGMTPFPALLRIPLALRWPGRLAPRKIEEPTDTRDLFATLADAAGLTGPNGKPLASEGRSLLRRPLPIPEGEPLHYAAAASVKRGIYSVQGRRWKLVWAPRTGIGWG